MNFLTTTEALSSVKTDLLVIRLFEGRNKLEPPIKKLDEALSGLLAQVIKSGDFAGKLGQTLLLFPAKSGACQRVLLLGLGKPGDCNLEKLRLAVAALTPYIQKHKIGDAAFALTKTLPPKASVEQTIQAIVEALVLGNYHFTAYKKPEPEEQHAGIKTVQFVLQNSRDKFRVLKGAEVGKALGEVVNLARDLGNHPANVATPSHLAQHAEKIAKQVKNVKVKILGRAEIKKENMGGLLSVARGSDEEPKFIILEYRPRKTGAPVVLVGKGITFDSGGINIKPSEKMEEMKCDMAGGAAVMSIISAAAQLKLPLNLVGLVPATENLPSGKATKPGDIVTARSGKTIEIVNTDAEGRLVLADALDYAKQYQPQLVIDFATLTGAIVVALGDDLIGAFTNKNKYLPALKNAAELTGEKIWPMPLEESYKELIKSDFADLRNIGTVRYGDSINAAVFLQNFVDYPWIHLDIAGVNYATREKPYRPKGATGTGVRLAIEFLRKFKK